MMIAVVGDYPIVAEFSKKSVYIFASVIAVVGFVMQDVVADTMSQPYAQLCQICCTHIQCLFHPKIQSNSGKNTTAVGKIHQQEGSNRKSYVYIGALLITISSLMMIAVVGDYPIVAEFSKKSVYIFASPPELTTKV
jgi:hypothetical protein